MAADRDRGFTLVEVVIAIVLVGILSSVVVVGVGQLTNRGTSASCAASQDAARAAATVHFGSTGSYPTTFTQLTAGSPPALMLPLGATVNATGDVVTVGSWSLRLLPGSGSSAPTFTCLDAGSPWTPEMLTVGLALWLDASDASTVTASGGAVSQWRDRSGNNRHAGQATATAQPLRVDAALGGRPAMVFDGTDDFMGLASALPAAGTNSFDVLVVAQPDLAGRNTAWGAGFVRQYAGSDAAGSWFVGYTGFGRTSLVHHLVAGNHATGTLQGPASSVASQSSQLFSYSYDAAAGSTTQQRWRISTGGQAPSTTTATPTETGWGTGNGEIGRSYHTPGYHLNGRLGEVIVTVSALGVADRQRMEGYLAHRWGMAANLPADHPYKSAPPLIGS